MKLRPLLIALIYVATSAAGYAQQQCASEGEAHWSYEGDTGPSCWVALERPKNFACRYNRTQSPVDLPTTNTRREPSTIPPGGAVNPTWDYQTVPLTVWNNGHTVQVNFALAGTPGGAWRFWYDPFTRELLPPPSYWVDLILQQVHFHSPSEHAFGGQRKQLEAHMVYQDDFKRTLVVGLTFDVGEENAFLKVLLDHFDVFQNRMDRPQTIQGARIGYRSLMRSTWFDSYFNYWGSLTTPPCTPSILWMVARQPVTATQAQIDKLKRALPATGNARPLQDLNGRSIGFWSPIRLQRVRGPPRREPRFLPA